MRQIRLALIAVAALVALLMVRASHAQEEPSFFARTGASIRKSTDRFSQRVKSVFQKKNTGPDLKKARTQDENDPVSLSSKPKKVDANFYVSLAQLNEQGGSLDTARKQYERALEIDPDDLAALLGYAHLCDRVGDSDKTTELLHRAVTAHPREAAPVNDLGLCYTRQGMRAEAEKAFRQAIALQPRKKLYRNNLATLLVESGRDQEALQHLLAVHEPAIAHYNIGFLLAKNRNPQAAMQHFQLAVAAKPDFQQARDWCDVLAAGGESAGGLAANLRPRPQAPPDLPAIDASSERASQSDSLPDAEPTLEAPASVEPSTPTFGDENETHVDQAEPNEMYIDSAKSADEGKPQRIVFSGRTYPHVHKTEPSPHEASSAGLESEQADSLPNAGVPPVAPDDSEGVKSPSNPPEPKATPTVRPPSKLSRRWRQNGLDYFPPSRY